MIIAEIAQAHDGSIGILHSYIDALAATGVDAVKFQTHIAEAESSEFETFRIPFSYVDKTRFDYWNRMELTVAQWKEVKSHCDSVGLKFISSPFSCKAVDVLEEAGVSTYKIGSGEVTNHLLLQKIAATGKPVILSSGMSTLEDLDAAIDMLRSAASVAVLQCTTAYPTQPHQWGLQIINTLKNRYNIPVGFSDHSGDIYACIAATALGAEILEFHAVFDKRMFGPDAKASIEIDDIKRLVEGVKQVRDSLSAGIEKNAQAEGLKDLKQLFGKSLSVNKPLPEGHIVSFEDLEAKKPAGKGIEPAHYKSIIGRQLKQAKTQWSFLQHEDISYE
ncbi:N-acetylneuraminate synthase family protein [Aridibaculum aurantiacum]|uniref:N-acetylneuraminate synthase family protein n=1 Tax=Aridibaculum aurantiacum TaxID=2810307 RepID=UPI001A968150|nr:N-acetylneuraminate synthase family protein [Aridibaculum aurantiacum]